MRQKMMMRNPCIKAVTVTLDPSSDSVSKIWVQRLSQIKPLTILPVENKGDREVFAVKGENYKERKRK